MGGQRLDVELIERRRNPADRLQVGQILPLIAKKPVRLTDPQEQPHMMLG